MVIHHPRRLHVRIAHGRTHEFEAALFQILAHRIRFRGGGGVFCQGFPVVDDGFTANKLPQIGIKTAEFCLHCQKALRIIDGCQYLQAVADDSGIAEQFLDFGSVIERDFFRVEIVKGLAVIFAFAQDGVPTLACLR